MAAAPDFARRATAAAIAMRAPESGSASERLFQVVTMAAGSAVFFGAIAAAASWRAKSRRERFVRFNAGVLLAWWCLTTTAKRFEVGAPKVPWLPFLSATRSFFDVGVHIMSCALLAIVTLFHGTSNRSVHALAVSLLYLAMSDPLFVGDWFIAPFVMNVFWCCPSTPQGSLAGAQLQMIFLMFGAGFSKLGPHFDRPGAGQFALLMRDVAPAWVADQLWIGREDLRPSFLAGALGVAMTLHEIFVPLFLLSASRLIVRCAVATLLLMHFVITLCVPILSLLQIWCSLSWCYLFLGGEQQGPSYGFDFGGARAMPRLVKVGACLFFALNLCAQLQPTLDWHPLLKYNHFASGNQPCDFPLLLRKGAADKIRKQVPFTPAAWEGDADPFFHHLVGRWFLELNHKGSTALVDCAITLAGGDVEGYLLLKSEEFTQSLAGAQSSTMNNYNLLFFQEVVSMGSLDDGDVMLVYLGPMAWPLLPLGHQAMPWSIWDGKRGRLLAGEFSKEELWSVALPSDASRLLPPECSNRSLSAPARR